MVTRRPVLAQWCATAVLIAGALVAPAALAFCRTTTCKGANCATDDNGCPASGAKLFWKGGCIGFSIEAAGARLIDKAKLDDAVRKSFRTWSQVDCGGGKLASITFADLGQTPCGAAAYNASGKNINVIAFQDDDWKFKEDNNVAKTSVHFDTKTGEIYDADIEVNTAVNLFTTDDKQALVGDKYLDLQTVLTHEIGHFLGLAHSERVDSVMFAMYKQGTLDGRTLTADDIAGLCAMYPPNRATTCDPTPLGGQDNCADSTGGTCSAGGGRAGSNGWAGSAAAAALALAGIGWRRRYQT